MFAFQIADWKNKKLRRKLWQHAEAYWWFDPQDWKWRNQKTSDVSQHEHELYDFDDWTEWELPLDDRNGPRRAMNFGPAKPPCTEHSFLDTGMVKTWCRHCEKAGSRREGQVVLD